MLQTTVANTMLMQSIQTFFAAVLGWIVLREGSSKGKLDRNVGGTDWCGGDGW